MMDGNYPPIMGELGMWEAHQQGIIKLRRRALATLAWDVTFRRWQGHDAKPEFLEDIVPAGTRVNVVMASRMGDVGITDDLEAEHGYHYRVTCVENTMFDKVFKPKGLLTNIEPMEDARTNKVKLAFPEGAKAPQDYPEYQ
jgi:hypothetical protein